MTTVEAKPLTDEQLRELTIRAGMLLRFRRPGSEVDRIGRGLTLSGIAVHLLVREAVGRPWKGTARVEADDEREYVEYVRSRLPRLYRAAYLVLGDGHRAEDAVQNALTTLYRRWSRRGQLDNLDAYVHTMVVRACLADQRRPWAKVFLRAEAPDAAVEGGDTLVDDRLAIRQALRRLPERQRLVIVLRFLCDLPIAEVAAAIGRSENTVKSHTAAALRTLRDIGELRLRSSL
ncbi:SigE family RNA polymerase sigma factor [Dactylosporangium sp. NPDC005555]|uniref:SigE family RNA polymerase sigma factor n=1 Tax=Dactylosporangium sp. NPDC005555 TaxID=3154889 RepID=UPI0033B77CA5